jgi:cytoskeletal protein CcmA (bactofilin family)
MPTREVTIQELHALLGENASFSGKLLFEGRVRIDGKFEGEIHGEDTLILGERSEVTANIDVAMLIVLGGVLRGDVRASRSVELHAPAKVYGNITTPQLVVDRGVIFEGQSKRLEKESPRLDAEAEDSDLAPLKEAIAAAQKDSSEP